MFKEILRFKWMAAVLIRNCIREYQDLNPLEIARLIKDEKVLLELIYDMPGAIRMMEDVYHVDLRNYAEGAKGKMGIIERQRYELQEKDKRLEKR